MDNFRLHMMGLKHKQIRIYEKINLDGFDIWNKKIHQNYLEYKKTEMEKREKQKVRFETNLNRSEEIQRYYGEKFQKLLDDAEAWITEANFDQKYEE